MSAPILSKEEYRKRYLASLTLEAKNDAFNLAANQMFKQTGQPSAPADTRTITEKVADVESLKNLVRQQLQGITDSTSASQIIGQLDADEIQFIFQQFGSIERDMTTRFREGVPADIFVQYLRRSMERFAETAGVETTVEEAVGPIVESIRKGSVAKRKASEGASGDYSSRVTLPSLEELAELPKSQTIKMWKGIKDEIFRQLRDEDSLTQSQIDNRKRIYRLITAGGTRGSDSIKNWISEHPNEWNDINGFMSGITGSGIMGCGIARKRPSKLPPRVEGGLKATHLANFGRYTIDLAKLDKGLARFKTNDGKGAVTKIHRVSGPVTNVLKKIAGGSLPDYEDIACLTEDEKTYMSDLMDKAKLNDKIKIPSPAKTKLQRESDRFEILKGQILSGNDSKELLREFKLLLLKLTKEKRIPRAECNEVLYELMVVGL
jgi:hypothetical protein